MPRAKTGHHIFNDPGPACPAADWAPRVVSQDPERHLFLTFAVMGADFGGPLPADVVALGRVEAAKLEAAETRKAAMTEEHRRRTAAACAVRQEERAARKAAGAPKSTGWRARAREKAACLATAADQGATITA